MAWALRKARSRRLDVGTHGGAEPSVFEQAEIRIHWEYLCLSRWGFAWTLEAGDAFRLSHEEVARGLSAHLRNIREFGEVPLASTGFGPDAVIEVVEVVEQAAPGGRYVRAFNESPFDPSSGWTWEICGPLPGRTDSARLARGAATNEETARRAAWMISEALGLEVRS